MKLFPASLAAIALAVLVASCKKEEEEPPAPDPTPAPTTIQYTDVAPDVTVDYTSDSLLVDIDGDGTDDVWLRAQLVVDYSGPVPVDNFYLKAIVLDSAVDVALGSWSGAYDLLASGDAVGDAVYWTNQPMLYGDEDGTIVGPWSVPDPDVTDGYIGVRTGTSGAYHYGWINVYVTSHTLTLKGHAYETTVNVPINAGETGQ